MNEINNFHIFMYSFIVVASLLNILHVGINMFAAELEDYQKEKNKQLFGESKHNFSISVVIPAYNEEKSIHKTLAAVVANDYSNKEIFVVDDGSADNTSKVVQEIISKEKDVPITLIKQKNQGKSVAINHAVADYATSDLIMVLDADSLLEPDALSKMTAHFRNKKIIGMATNVKILKHSSWLNLAQRFEFLTAYRGKNAEQWLKTLYIVGGVGSTFQRDIMLEAGMYDTDTITEDIDFTMKLIHKYGNKRNVIGYASDVIVHTEPVIKFHSLINQRFRWKYGRFKAFLKYRSLFFSTDKKYSKWLTWITLPQSLLQELFMLIEPFIFLYIQWMIFRYTDWFTFLAANTFFATVVCFAVTSDRYETKKEKFKFILLIPIAYWTMFVLTIVEYISLLKSIYKIKDLLTNKEQHANWEHVERL
ncbi:glycosyltransferase [Enterococcus hirae]|nr:glycosyltransferase [Enterococcus hirae]EMF0233839.1 glycosyltransferase [Enterococcus hirae]